MGALEVKRYLRRFEMAGKPVLKNLRVSSGPWCWVGVLGLTILSVTFAACSSQRGAEAPARPAATTETASSSTPAAPTAEAGAAPSVNAARAMQYTKEVVAFGARP